MESLPQKHEENGRPAAPPLAWADPSAAVPVPPSARAEEKVENATQYQQYVQETKPLREQLGVLLKEELCASPSFFSLSLISCSSSPLVG